MARVGDLKRATLFVVDEELVAGDGAASIVLRGQPLEGKLRRRLLCHRR